MKLLTAVLMVLAALQEPPPGRGRPPGPGLVDVPKGDRIAWFGTWEGGLAEARRTQRPILLVSAAPHCHNVPGIW